MLKKEIVSKVYLVLVNIYTNDFGESTLIDTHNTGKRGKQQDKTIMNQMGLLIK